MPATANRRSDGPPGSASRSRRRGLIIVGLVAVAVVVSALVGWRYARESAPVTGPIVLISIDPLRADHLGVYGGGAPTPHLDRLAAGATIFTQAYAHAAGSLPAYASLLTGQLPPAHGVRDDFGFPMRRGTQTLASRLASRGFETGAAVSTWRLRAGVGLDTGFAHYDAALTPFTPDTTKTKAATTTTAVTTLDTAPPPVERSSAATARLATRWLDEQDSERFFYALQLNGEPPGERPLDRTRDTHGLAEADAAVGSVLDTLRRKGWYDNALVLVTSTYGGPPDGVDPGRGFTLDAPVLRVPMVVKMPGAHEARRVDAPFQHVDVVPTVLDLVRAPGDGGPGRSWRGVLEGDTASSEPRGLYAEAMAGTARLGWTPLAAAPSAEAGAAPRRDEAIAALDTLPLLVPPAERDLFARLGEVAPVLPPRLDRLVERPDLPAVRALLAAYRRAAAFDADRDLPAAIAGYREVLSRGADDADAWYRLGAAAERLDRSNEALQAFARVQELRPDLAAGTVAAARVEIARGALDAATTRLTARLEEATLTGQELAAVHARLADIAVTRRRAEAARTHAADAGTALPAMPFTAFVEARLLYDAGEYEKALAAFDDVAARIGEGPSPFESLAWYRADCLARLDRHDDAVAAYARAIADAPFDVRAYVGLATLQRTMGDDDAAAATVDRLLRQAPTPPAYTAAVRLLTAWNARERAAALRAEARQRFAGEPGLPAALR